MYATALKNGAAVLMARIVDTAGVFIRPSWVAAIEYSIYERHPRWPDKPMVVARHDAIPLDVADVVFDSLQTDRSWAVDVSGYNFRHRIDVGRDGALFNAGALYDVRYLFTPMFGQMTVIQFQLRCVNL
jgi:hypothetical protein